MINSEHFSQVIFKKMNNIIVLSLVTLFLCIQIQVSAQYKDIKYNAFIHEVDIGKNAVLKCKSNDANTHVFLFWENLKFGLIIGPTNVYDEKKYDFDVLSGNLTIRVRY